jgi:hypothetical protein
LPTEAFDGPARGWLVPGIGPDDRQNGLALVYLLFVAKGFYLWMPIGSGVMLFVGLYWLWADYINAEPRPENDYARQAEP